GARSVTSTEAEAGDVGKVQKMKRGYSPPLRTEALLLWSQGGLFDIKDKGEPRRRRRFYTALCLGGSSKAMWFFRWLEATDNSRLGVEVGEH
ncbi:cytochrome c1 family protein, partial [Sesbania bispinosa]